MSVYLIRKFFFTKRTEHVRLRTILIYFSKRIDRQTKLKSNRSLECDIMWCVYEASNSDQRTRSAHIDKVNYLTQIHSH